MEVVEAKRIKRIIGLDAVRTPEELRCFFDTATMLVIPSAIEFTVDWAPHGLRCHPWSQSW